jgi:oligogalacturonide transport system permease protein
VAAGKVKQPSLQTQRSTKLKAKRGMARADARTIPLFLQKEMSYMDWATKTIKKTQRHKWKNNGRKGSSLFDNKKGYLYLLPWLVGVVALQLYPFISSLYYSFTDYSMISDTHFIGFSNYIKILTDDPKFKMSLSVTLIYVLFTVPLKMGFALFIAVLLNMKLRGIRIFRTLYYLPSILGGSVGIAILWRSLFNSHGIINLMLANLGVKPVDFLGSPDVALYTIGLMAVWQFGASMVLFLAALEQVPYELVEAAHIDGAGKFRVFRSVTLPHITPIIFFNLIMETIIAFQQFSGPFLITNGGPLFSTYLYGLMLYENAFTFLKMGYACAQSWILFLIVLAFTALVFKSSPYWTYYDDGGKF